MIFKKGKTMIHLVICDDDRDFALRLKTELEKLLAERSMSARILAFASAEEIGQETLADCEIAFLDIDFAGKRYNGIDIARRMRRSGSEAVIVFVSNFVEYAPEGYEVQAFRYLLKDELPRKLAACLDQILEQQRTRKMTFRIQSEGEQISLALSEVLYLESMGHTLLYHVLQKGFAPDRVYSCYGAIGKMEEELAQRGFLRTQKSYLVNMAHIRKFNSRELLLSNGVSLPVSDKSYAACKRQYLLWRGKQ